MTAGVLGSLVKLMQRISALTAALLAGVASGAAVASVVLVVGVGDAGETAVPEPERPAPREQKAGRAAARETRPSGTAIGEIYRRARDAVFVVEGRQPGVDWPEGPPRHDDGVATGTGFAIGRRRIVTNHHVVAGAELVAVRLRGRRVRARVVGSDASSDLAILRLPRVHARRLGTLPLGSSGDVRPGDTAVAIGNPYGLARTLTAGVVSAVRRRITAPDGSRIANAIQTDAAINPGNSGGPLLDANGRVIGVLAQARGDGIAFAVPVDRLKRVAPRLERGARRSGPKRS